MQPNRLPNGGRIDRTRPLSFRFDGKKYRGYAGDTLASALLANGVTIVGRSFKLHRPRGIVGAGAEEPNAIVQIGKGGSAEPNLRATQVELYEGLIARSTKGWPNARFDLAAVSDVFSRVRMLRQWGGIVDVCPDACPIISKTPVDGLYFNCGWGTGGFKATPGSGWVFAHTIARDEPHELNGPFNLERFTTGALIDEHGAAAVAH